MQKTGELRLQHRHKQELQSGHVWHVTGPLSEPECRAIAGKTWKINILTGCWEEIAWTTAPIRRDEWKSRGGGGGERKKDYDRSAQNAGRRCKVKKIPTDSTRTGGCGCKV